MRIYSLKQRIDVEFLDDEEDGVRLSLCFRLEREETSGYSFRHSSKTMTISTAATFLEQPSLLRMIRDYYVRNECLSPSEATLHISDETGVTLWARLCDDRNPTMRNVSFRALCFASGEDERQSCYLAGAFEAMNESIDVYYGRAHAFLQIRTKGQEYMLVLTDWADGVLQVGEQRQVFANVGSEHKRLFEGLRIDSIICVSHQIMLLECLKPRPSNRTIRRTYFIDEQRGGHNMLEDTTSTRNGQLLRGLS